MLPLCFLCLSLSVVSKRNGVTLRGVKGMGARELALIRTRLERRQKPRLANGRGRFCVFLYKLGQNLLFTSLRISDEPYFLCLLILLIRPILSLEYHARLYYFHSVPCTFWYLTSILCLCWAKMNALYLAILYFPCYILRIYSHRQGFRCILLVCHYLLIYHFVQFSTQADNCFCRVLMPVDRHNRTRK